VLLRKRAIRAVVQDHPIATPMGRGSMRMEAAFMSCNGTIQGLRCISSLVTLCLLTSTPDLPTRMDGEHLWRGGLQPPVTHGSFSTRILLFSTRLCVATGQGPRGHRQVFPAKNKAARSARVSRLAKRLSKAAGGRSPKHIGKCRVSRCINSHHNF